MLAISIDDGTSEAAAEYDLRPAAPKRRRGNERGERLAGFTAAARTATLNEGSASRIQACQRGHIIRRDVARLRPPSAGESASSYEEIAEEIEEHEVCDGLSELLLRQQDSNSQADAAESVLENSYTEELESSNDSSSGALATMVATATALRQRALARCGGRWFGRASLSPGRFFALTEAGRGYIRLAMVPSVDNCKLAAANVPM